jgi:hypothetical protein
VNEKFEREREVQKRSLKEKKFEIKREREV